MSRYPHKMCVRFVKRSEYLVVHPSPGIETKATLATAAASVAWAGSDALKVLGALQPSAAGPTPGARRRSGQSFETLIAYGSKEHRISTQNPLGNRSDVLGEEGISRGASTNQLFVILTWPSDQNQPAE